MARKLLTSALVTAGLMAAALVAAQSPRSSAGSTAIVPFKINVPDRALADLKDRLARARFPDEIPNQGWKYGTNLTYLKDLVKYWHDRFDWRAQERKLNQFDQFRTTIDGVTIHFIHQKAKRPGALPLLITHGWPGSVVEFEKVIGPLTDPEAYGGRAEDAFDVVAASLPGFGFSDHPQEPGWGPPRMAGMLAQLMARLGYTRYVAQGGDWGSIISSQLARDDAAHMAALHLNFCTGGAGTDTAGVPPAELERIRVRQAERADDNAYSNIQGTRPQTLGYALNDSPVGTAAWIVEKFYSWSDVKDSPEEKFTKDELLTNITLYWVTESEASSARIYYESQHGGRGGGAAPTGPARITVPTACAIFPKEISFTTRKSFESRYNLARWTEMPRGGHFAAMEEPQLLVNDMREFFRAYR